MLEKLSGLETEARLKVIDEAFDNVFSSPDGQIVLGVLLDDMCFMDVVRDEGMQALNNYAKALLHKLSPRISDRAVETWRRVTSKEV
jgi:hypothetical protein